MKIRLLNALIIPIAIYGSETWTITKVPTNKIAAFEMTCLRNIANIHWQERLTNTDVLEQLHTERTIIKRIRQSQKRYLGHIIRMDNDRIPKRAFEMIMGGDSDDDEPPTRPRGKPRTR